MSLLETKAQPDSPSPAVIAPVVTWLRLEGLAVALLSILLYAHTGASWWLFTGWLVPDISFVVYLAGPRWGAAGYNTVHSYVLPAILAGVALFLHPAAPLMPIALIWFNHIGVDRTLGYGLKYPTGFGFTHLKRPGKLHPEK
jgi:hypothetical protein